MTDDPQIKDDHRTAVCILYTPVSPPGDLLDALLARRVDVRHERDPYNTLASLHEARPSAGEPRIPVVLTAVEPDQLPLICELVDTVEEVLPDCILWQHRSDQPVPLSAVTPRDRGSWRQPPATSSSDPLSGVGHGDAPPRPIATPRLRLTRDAATPRSQRSAEAAVSGSASNSGAVSSDTEPREHVGLSDAELSTLLGQPIRGEQHIGS